MSAESARGAAGTFSLPIQAAALGLIIIVMDHVALGATQSDILQLFRELRAEDNMWLDASAQEELQRFAESGTTGTLPFAIFFLAVAPLYAFATIGLRRGTHRSTAAGLFLTNTLTPVYLVALVIVSRWEYGGALYEYVSSSDAELIIDSSTPDWYIPVRFAVLGAAAMAYAVTAFTVARLAAARLRDWTAPRGAALLLGHVPLAGPIITVLGFAAIDQAYRISGIKVATVEQGYFAMTTEAAWWYATLFAVAGVIMWALAWCGRHAGRAHLLPAGLGILTAPFLLLLLMASVFTPFDNGVYEDVADVLGTGPVWYVPALLTQTSLTTVTFVASIAVTLLGTRRTSSERDLPSANPAPS
ncbi:hypothetical protein [Streptosporangium sp. KLBMP 9127]|nr:hypothetical protein [Streptosporangium sp. KLBMP 9127]